MVRLHLRQIFPINQGPIAILKWLFNRRAAVGRTVNFAGGLTAAFAGHGTAVQRIVSPINAILLGCTRRPSPIKQDNKLLAFQRLIQVYTG
ncbi:MAG: hypothetical protein R6X34_23330 [Chloroflexota bacterium]